MIIEFGFAGIEYKKGTFFGRNNEYYIYSLRFIFVTIQYLPKQTRVLFMNALDGVTEDKDWLIKNNREIVKYRNSLKQDIRNDIKSEYKSRTKQVKQDRDKYYEENQKLRTENHTLRSAIRYIKPTA